MKNVNPDQPAVTALVESSITSYNIGGFTPVMSVFRLVPDQLKKILFECTKSFLSDVRMVTLDIDYTKGIIGAFAWIPDDSDSIRDTSTLSDKSAIRKPIYRYSQQLREFMDRFCPNDSKRIFKDENNMHLMGIPILVDRMLMIVFDANGDKFAKEYDMRDPVKTRIRLLATFAKGDDTTTYGKFRYLEVQKAIKSDLLQREPKAKKSYKY